MDPVTGIGSLVFLLVVAHVAMGAFEELGERSKKLRSTWNRASNAPWWTRQGMTAGAMRGLARGAAGAVRATATTARWAGRGSVYLAAGIGVGAAHGWRAGTAASQTFHALREAGWSRRQALTALLPRGAMGREIAATARARATWTRPPAEADPQPRLVSIPVDGPDEPSASGAAGKQRTKASQEPDAQEHLDLHMVLKRLGAIQREIGQKLEDGYHAQSVLEQADRRLRVLRGDIHGRLSGPAAHAPTISPTLTVVDGSASAEQHNTSKGRNTMSTITGEATNIEATRSNLGQIAEQATRLTDAIEQMSGHLHQADLDRETLAEIAALSEAVEMVQDRANRARDGLNRRHSHMEEAVNSTPHVAQTAYYRG